MGLTTPTSNPPAIDRVLARIEAFQSTLSDRQLARLRLDHSRALAARWSNLPEAVLGAHGRPGLSTGTLDRDGWAALWELLAATTGSAPGLGLDALRQHLAADDLLAERDGHMGYGRGSFTIALLGRPGARGEFAVQFGGHHLALLNSYRDGALVAATPAFRGIEPFAPFTREGRVNRPLHARHAALSAALTCLDDGRRAHARLRRVPGDLLLGPGEDGRFPDRRRGLCGADLDAGQRGRLRAAIGAFTGDVPDGAGDRFLAGYDRELDETRLAFGGSPALTATGDYVRIDGPSVWIELSMRPGINFAGPHPHAVWRDRSMDYGGGSGS